MGRQFGRCPNTPVHVEGAVTVVMLGFVADHVMVESASAMHAKGGSRSHERVHRTHDRVGTSVVTLVRACL
jgi:hypothetical protein